MLLMLQSWRNEHAFELAMLLDESPYHNYQPVQCGSEPWHARGALATAMRSADLHGCAWLYVVYQSDPPIEWGGKRVKLVSGAVIMREATANGGAPTGRFDVLRYRTLRPDVFRNLVGTEWDRSTRLVCDAVFTAQPGSIKREPVRFIGEPRASESAAFRKAARHDVLGITEPQIACRPGKHDQPLLVPKPFHGFQISESLPGGETQSAYVGHEEGGATLEQADSLAEQYIQRYQFFLTEYTRRPLVALILSTLAFVAGDVPSIEAACLPYLRQVQEALEGLTNVTDCGIYR